MICRSTRPLDVRGERALIPRNPCYEKLRSEAPPPRRPAIVVTRRSQFTDIYVEADRLFEQISTVADDGTLRIVQRAECGIRVAPGISRRPRTCDGSARRTTSCARTQKRGGSHQGVRRQATADRPAVDCTPGRCLADDQFAWFDWLRSLGAPGGRVGRLPNEPVAMVEAWPHPSECQLVSRRIQPIAELRTGYDSDELVPADRASLIAVGGQEGIIHARVAKPMPAELSRASFREDKSIIQRLGAQRVRHP